MAKVRIGGKEYQSERIDLVKGVNLVPIKTGELTRYLAVGASMMLRPYKKASGDGY